ncbi:hypothetical protein SAMN02745181_0581 [Rubritalea squalenifaciens DSM 18772]|uniref:Uncharacterized protein n=1 Tax=Rubritalea squalenifaciens DSM 18772 TaxID=1123071 RepID=A0A1M6CVU0_9BACT|nr:hypothetical protein [Rubritalea squalenifaciens]SHI65127.1 hypothetical protein SAMN02745181_0581 [Rubritalea squalenifaciens DSM 18772]
MIHTLATWADAIPDEAAWALLLLLLLLPGLVLFGLGWLIWRLFPRKQQAPNHKKDQ